MYKIVLITSSENEGYKIAEILVKERLVACVNIIPIQSIYSWKDKIESDKENLLIIKTKSSLIEKLKKKIKEIHSYENPELIVLSIEDGLPAYLNWIDKSVES